MREPKVGTTSTLVHAGHGLSPAGAEHMCDVGWIEAAAINRGHRHGYLLTIIFVLRTISSSRKLSFAGSVEDYRGDTALVADLQHSYGLGFQRPRR